MIDRLQVFENRYEELSEKLCDPSVTSSAELYTEVMKEYKAVEPIALKYREYKNSVKELSEARELLEENKNDSEGKRHISSGKHSGLLIRCPGNDQGRNCQRLR